MATYDFLNLEYPQIEEVKKHEQPAEVKNEVSEEVRPEAQVPESKEQSTGKKSRKPRAPKATTEEVVVAPETPAADYEPYDRTNVKHKDAYILLLDTINSNWREMGKEAPVQLSTSMVGKPFLMGNDVNSNFKSEVETYVQAKLSK
jgi:hypothetical protein